MEASPRSTWKCACTAGSTTAITYMPLAPTIIRTRVMHRRITAKESTWCGRRDQSGWYGWMPQAGAGWRGIKVISG
jgi:hypothetical protein